MLEALDEKALGERGSMALGPATNQNYHYSNNTSTQYNHNTTSPRYCRESVYPIFIRFVKLSNSKGGWIVNARGDGWTWN